MHMKLVRNPTKREYPRGSEQLANVAKERGALKAEKTQDIPWDNEVEFTGLLNPRHAFQLNNNMCSSAGCYSPPVFPACPAKIRLFPSQLSGAPSCRRSRSGIKRTCILLCCISNEDCFLPLGVMSDLKYACCRKLASFGDG